MPYAEVCTAPLHQGPVSEYQGLLPCTADGPLLLGGMLQQGLHTRQVPSPGGVVQRGGTCSEECAAQKQPLSTAG